MDNKSIKYGDSKAIKITNDMKSDLNSYNSRQNEIYNLEKEKESLDNSRIQKDTELEQLKAEGKKSKETKPIEKEIEKIVSEIKSIDEQIEKAQKSHKKPEIAGATLTSFASFINENTAEESIAQKEEATKEVAETEENQENVDKQEEITKEEPKIEETSEPIEENQENIVAETPIVVEEKEADTSEEVSETENIQDTNPEIEVPTEEAPEPTPEEPIIPESQLDKVEDGPTEEPKEEPAKVEESKEEKQPETEKEESNENTLISELETEEDKKEEENTNMFNYDFISQEEFDKMWKDLEGMVSKGDTPNKLADYNEDEFFEKMNLKPQIPEPIKVTRIEDNPDDLTKFDDYNDYVFAFGQNYYGKEALTPVEIGDLNKVQEFLNEDNFDEKRNTQYTNIVNENNDLKNQIIELDNNYRQELENISSEYSANMTELKRLIELAKEETENIKFEKQQTDKLNLTLTNTIKDQDQTILDLNVKNSGLQDTIVNQSNKITNLEKTNEEQSIRISELEMKFNSVQDILK